jgi:hypothetical protein
VAPLLMAALLVQVAAPPHVAIPSMDGRVGTRSRTKARAQRPLRSMRVWDEVTSTVQRLFQEEAVGADSASIRIAGRMFQFSLFFATDYSGERGRNRTYNLVIKSHLLCQLSYAPVRYQ